MMASPIRISDVPNGNIGDMVDLNCMIAKIEKKKTRQEKDYLQITIQDATGRLEFPVWGGFDYIEDVMIEGDVVRVSARIDTYEGANQLAKPSLTLLDADEFPREKFIPHYNIEDSEIRYFLTLIDRHIADPYNSFVKVCLGIESRKTPSIDKTLWENFLACPSAVKYHGNKRGGLFLHTFGMFEAGINLVEQYFGINTQTGTPYANYYGDAAGFDSSRFFAKILLHDIAKTRDYEFDTVIAKRKGSKIDHRGRGLMYITKMNEQMKTMCGYGLDEDDMDSFAFSILSHHGSFGDGQYSFDTLEDCLLHLLDTMDARIVGCMEAGDYKF